VQNGQNLYMLGQANGQEVLSSPRERVQNAVALKRTCRELRITVEGFDEIRRALRNECQRAVELRLHTQATRAGKASSSSKFKACTTRHEFQTYLCELSRCGRWCIEALRMLRKIDPVEDHRNLLQLSQDLTSEYKCAWDEYQAHRVECGC
jgi:hypothetical protein